MVSDRQGVATPYAMQRLQARGNFFVEPQSPVYEGQLRQGQDAAEAPQPATHQPDEGEGAHGVPHIFFVPLELRHRQGRKHRKGHRDGLQNSHSFSPPL